MAYQLCPKFQQDKYPISMRWSIYREDVEAHDFFQTKEFVAKHFFGVSYSIRFFVSETHQDERGNAAVYFYLNPNDTSGVTAKVSIAVPTLGKTYAFERVFKKAEDWGVPICLSDYFLDIQSPAFVNDEFVIEVKGMLFVETAPNALIGQYPLGYNIMEHGDKDFTLVMDGKELLVHKIVLASCSDVFADIFQAVNMNEEENNRLEIDDFSYETVEAAIMFIYQENGYINDANIAEVCKFADKFEIKHFKDIITQYMKDTICNMNVCQYINAAHHLQAPRLERRCMEFLRQCGTNKIAVVVDELYPGLAKKFIAYSYCNQIG